MNRMGRKRLAGKLFVISAPSGCGKTTLCKRLLKDDIGLLDSVSVTTRPPRQGEKGGVDYHFVSKKRFQGMIERGALLEYEDNFGHLYGTPKKFIDKTLKDGKSVLLSIDVKGAMKVRKLYSHNSVLIFVLPPSLGELKKRLKYRMSDGAAAISKRLATARKEIAYKRSYDYRIVNDRLDSAYKRLKKMIVTHLH